MPPKRTAPIGLCAHCGQPIKYYGQTYCSRRCFHDATMRDPLARFWEKVEKTDGCWLWRGSRYRNGYARFSARRRWHLAHRYLFEALNGPLPAEIQVCHTCDNRICVRPDHLFPGTRRDNMDDMLRKGRQSRGSRKGTAKLDEASVREIRRLRRETDLTLREIAERFGVHAETAGFICRGKTWRHVPL